MSKSKFLSLDTLVVWHEKNGYLTNTYNLEKIEKTQQQKYQKINNENY